MTGKTGVEHPFRVLEINIIDDQQTVEGGYQAVIKKYKRYENSPNPQERARYKELFLAYKELKDPDRRKKIIEDYILKLQKDIEIFLSGKTIIEKNALDELVNSEVERWGFHPQLAREKIQQSLEQKGIEVGKKIAKEPMLVSNAAIDSDKIGIRLSWNLPSSNCDEVLVIRRDDRFPKHANDGKETFRGMAAEYKDNDISPGKGYYYSIFTLFEGRISKNPIHLKECIIAPPSNVKVKNGCTEVSLHWDSPDLAERTIIIRQANKEPVVKLTKDSMQINEGQKIYEGVESDYNDIGLMVDTGYYYSLISVFPGNRYSEAVVVSGKTLGLPGVPAGLSILEQESGVLLRWQQLPNVEGFHLVRKDHSPPVNETDGKILYKGPSSEYEDTDLQDGVLYYYALYSFVGSYFSNKGVTEMFFLKKDPQDINLSIHDACIKIEWRLPPGASGVMVRRSDTQPPANVNEGTPIPVKLNKQVADYRVINGKTYHYTLFSIYTSRGKTEYSKGKQMQNLVPSGPPAPVENIRLSHDENAACIIWDRPIHQARNSSIGGICVTYSHRPFGCSKGHRMKFSEIKENVIGWAEYPLSFEHSQPPKGQIGYYAVFTAANRGASREQSDFEVTFCGEEVLDLLRNVENVNHRWQSDGSLCIYWDWPPGCEVVYIARSATTPPAKIEHKRDHKNNRFIAVDHSGEPIDDAIVRGVPKRQYQVQKGYIDKDADFPNIYYRICTAAPGGGDIKFSHGKELEINKK